MDEYALGFYNFQQWKQSLVNIQLCKGKINPVKGNIIDPFVRLELNREELLRPTIGSLMNS